MKWYYQKHQAKAERGPVSFSDLADLVTQGKLKANDFVRSEKSEWWQTVKDCKKLKPILDLNGQSTERTVSPSETESPHRDTFIGIDFGTTKTMVAEYQQQKKSAKVHKLGRELEMPTLIHDSETGERVFGDMADDEGDHDPIGRIHRFKLDLGKPCKQFGRKTCTAMDLTADFLAHLRELLKEEVTHHLVERVVLTVPAIFGPAQRKDLTHAAKLAGFKQVELLPEPVAAGIAYCDHEGLNGKLRFLVVDWGGGTFDLALADRDEAGGILVPKEFVKGRVGIGGEDLDDDFWAATSSRLVKDGRTALEARANTSQGKYRRDLRCTKERLSHKLEVPLPLLTQDNQPEMLTWTRSELEDVLSERIRKGVSAVAELVELCVKADMTPEFILLAGGTSRTPLIHKLLAETCSVPCRPWKEGRDAIALGAALYAHKLWGDTQEAVVAVKIDPAKEMKAAHSLYRKLLEAAWLDGHVTEEEQAFLEKERKVLKIRVKEATLLQTEIFGCSIKDVVEKQDTKKAKAKSRAQAASSAKREQSRTRLSDEILRQERARRELDQTYTVQRSRATNRPQQTTTTPRPAAPQNETGGGVWKLLAGAAAVIGAIIAGG
jgi:molecular chaperone DnaK